MWNILKTLLGWKIETMEFQMENIYRWLGIFGGEVIVNWVFVHLKCPVPLRTDK